MFLCLFKTIVKFHDSLNDSVIVLNFRNNRNFRKRRGLLEVGHSQAQITQNVNLSENCFTLESCYKSRQVKF